MKLLVHSFSARYALALWLATVLALLVSFVLQLEPAQWSAITVWIMFIQTPRLNFSKVVWWAFGTITGAAMAVWLIACFSQTPELFLLGLGLWLAVCAGTSTFVTSYRAYGGVLAGYTCAIVSMSAVDHPDLIFRLAVTRVSCIFVGMTSAILMFAILLPKHRHWPETLRQLGGHLKATLRQAAQALTPGAAKSTPFTWRHTVDRLSALEHTFDTTLAETADSRTRAPQVRGLVASLFELHAQAQGIELHLSRANAVAPAPGIDLLLTRTRALLLDFAEQRSAKDVLPEIGGLRQEVAAGFAGASLSDRFVLDRLDEALHHFALAAQDWAGLFGPWTARRTVKLEAHRDHRTAFIYGLRMFFAMMLASAIWFITAWPSGAQFILFTAVVCSLLSLVDYAPLLGFEFLKSAVFCAIMAYIETFWLLQRGEGFLVLAVMLGIFLLPAAYAYNHPRLIGGAVVSMLIFYGLSMPANEMHYDILAFLNNGLALLGATVCGFFSFHVVPSLTAQARKVWLLRAVRHDLANGYGSDEGWISRLFDRLRLLHRAAAGNGGAHDFSGAETEMLLDLQLGLRQRRLRAHLSEGSLQPANAKLVADVLREFREIVRHPAIVAVFLRTVCAALQEAEEPGNMAGALAEMWEMTLLLETSNQFAHGSTRKLHV